MKQLVEQNRVVVLKPFYGVTGDGTGRMVGQDNVKEFLEACRTVSWRKSVANQLAIPTGPVLLRHPLALLAIPSCYEKYLKEIAHHTRQKVRKAAKEGYHYREFDWNDHLDDIFKINTSKEIRSGGAMRGWYREPVKPRYHSTEERYYKKYYGLFKDDRLCAYLYLVLCGDCCYFKHIIGHADQLKKGIMYYLVSCTIQHYVGHPHIKWLNYSFFKAGAIGATTDFRTRARFQGYATFLDLENDEELLKYARKARARGLMSV